MAAPPGSEGAPLASVANSVGSEIFHVSSLAAPRAFQFPHLASGATSSDPQVDRFVSAAPPSAYDVARIASTATSLNSVYAVASVGAPHVSEFARLSSSNSRAIFPNAQMGSAAAAAISSVAHMALAPSTAESPMDRLGSSVAACGSPIDRFTADGNSTVWFPELWTGWDKKGPYLRVKAVRSRHGFARLHRVLLSSTYRDATLDDIRSTRIRDSDLFSSQDRWIFIMRNIYRFDMSQCLIHTPPVWNHLPPDVIVAQDSKMIIATFDVWNYFRCLRINKRIDSFIFMLSCFSRKRQYPSFDITPLFRSNLFAFMDCLCDLVDADEMDIMC